MKINLLKSILIGLILLATSKNGNAQNVIWSDTFTQAVAPTAAQITKWDNWRASLSPGQYTFMTIKGTYNQTGITCTDKTIVNNFATAVKNYTTYISGTTGGHVWSICNRYLGEIWLDPPASCSGSNCPTPNAYIIRPGIGTGNSNWGGVNTSTCGAITQRMIFIFGKPSKPNEMGVSGLTSPNLCTNTQSLTALLSNSGTNYIDSFRLYWSVNGVLQTPFYIKSHLKSGTDTSKVLNSAFNFVNNTSYTFKVWTHRPNDNFDSIPDNDTFRFSFSFLGNPNPPGTTNFIQCGNGKPILSATPSSASDTILWYPAASGGTLLGIGRTITGPYITSTSTFYAQAMRFGGTVTFNNGMNGPTILSGVITDYNGGMFNVAAINLVSLDSITMRCYQLNANTRVRLYYKTGTYAGFETNAGAWTLLYSGLGRNFTSGGRFFSRMPTGGLTLTGGQTYAFYMTTDPVSGGGNDLYATSGFITTSNADLSIIGGTFIYGLYATNGIYSPYTMDIELHSKKTCSNPTRTALTVTVKPRPTGADIVKGSTFQGQFRVGDNTSPDITEAGKTIIYQLAPPTGFTDAGHNSTWVINSISARTRYGILIPATDYSVVDPSSSGPGTITYTPKSSNIDSFITFSVNYSDLGPYFCDSTLKRTIVIAPTPWPNFKFPASICLGDAVLFDNTTTIQSGNATYTWYFGNGDTSDLQSPVYEYKAPGVYNVRLVAKSFPWNVSHDTTITVEVGELPTTKFRVNNKCQGIAVTFQNQTVVANGALTYDWDFGDGSAHTTATNPSHLYATPGGYKVTLKASANGCVATLVKNAYMFARPVANFAAPLAPVCAKTEVVFPNTSTIALGNQGAYWTFGDGTGSTLFDGINNYSNPGTYTVKLLAVSEFDCKDSITKSATIKPTPTPDFAGNQFCGKIPTIFINSTVEALPNPVYNWTFSDNFTSTQKNVTHSWPHEGPFTVILKASYSNTCSGSVTKDFNVLIQPEADFTVENICSGETADFVNLTKGDRGNIQYFWDFGNSTNSTIPSPTRLYNPTATTTYTVTLVASYLAGCSDTVRKTITVSESPLCDFTYKELGFLNGKFTPANTSYPKYEWFFGEGGTSKSTEPNYQYKYSGNFKVTMHATNLAGCTCEITKRISANTAVGNPSAIHGMKVYPNPNNGSFTVSNSGEQSMKVEVFNVLGSKIYSKTSSDGTLDVNLQDHAKGIYLVKVTINGVTSTTKITIDR